MSSTGGTARIKRKDWKKREDMKKERDAFGLTLGKDGVGGAGVDDDVESVPGHNKKGELNAADKEKLAIGLSGKGHPPDEFTAFHGISINLDEKLIEEEDMSQTSS